MIFLLKLGTLRWIGSKLMRLGSDCGTLMDNFEVAVAGRESVREKKKGGRRVRVVFVG